MSAEGFEEWDADFLDQLIQVEELALSSSSSSIPNPNPHPSTTPSVSLSNAPPLHHHFHHQQQQNPSHSLSYSPPRELSQRPTDFINSSNGATFGPLCDGSVTLSSAPLRLDHSKDLEIDRLKKELGRVSKQLTYLERECFELGKKTKKKNEQIKSVYSHSEETGVAIPCFKNSNLECGAPSVDLHAKSAKASESQMGYDIDRGTSGKAVGVQTDNVGDHANLDSEDYPSSWRDLSKKLLGIWGSTCDPSVGRNLMSKLFMACSGDFHVLFGCMSLDISSELPLHTSEAAKVSHLYTVLTKIGNGLLQMEALFEPLLDLCELENVVILRSSLRILHVFLRHLLSLRTTLEERDNVKVEGMCSGNNTKGRGLFIVGRDEAPYTGYGPSGIRSSDPQLPCKGSWSAETALARVNWMSVFELMQRIATSNTKESVRLEAVSIMNVILMRSIAYTEREHLGQRVVFESIAQLLRNGAGSFVQKEVLHLLYMLLNCPKALSIFCSGCEEEESDDTVDNKKNAPTNKAFSSVLKGLAECISCSGNSIQDIELRKRAIIILAFLASSGKSGFEILVSRKLIGEANFLALILQVLVSEMDFEVNVPSDPVENTKARTLFIREALILLNRLVSNPVYSATVFRALTASRDMASLTIDIANRFSRKDKRPGLSDANTLKMRESEIVDLARVFQKRVFTYLGDNRA